MDILNSRVRDLNICIAHNDIFNNNNSKKMLFLVESQNHVNNFIK